MSASWLRFSLKAPASSLDAISNFLIERGSPGVVLKRDQVEAYFPRSRNVSALKQDVESFLEDIREVYPAVGRSPPTWAVLKDRNWNRSWRRFFSPQKIGKGLWITPPWSRPPRFVEREVIVIEPGMAFGTGTHHTTRGCLEFLEAIMASLRVEKKAITGLDVGTGSGILAITLAKLGAKKVVALDNDPMALKACRLNVRRNGVGRAVKCLSGGLSGVRGSFTVVAANLVAETLIVLARRLEKKVAGDGYLVLSGILRPKARDVLRHFSTAGFVLVGHKNLRGWVTLVLRRES